MIRIRLSIVPSRVRGRGSCAHLADEREHVAQRAVEEGQSRERQHGAQQLESAIEQGARATLPLGGVVHPVEREQQVREHERDLTAYMMEALAEVDGLTILGPEDADLRGCPVSFAIPDVHPHDVAQLVDREGVCVRAGHHCAKPLMRTLGVTATTRASTHVYNGRDDVDALVAALQRARNFMAG